MPDARVTTHALEVRLAPEGVLSRLRAAINRPPKRVFGIKAGPEFVGVVSGSEFEVWERRGHAVHLIGQVKGRRGGSRIEARTAMSPRTKVLIVLFFVLFAIVAYGFTTLPTERPVPALSGPLAAVAGGVAAAAIFWWQTRVQRAALRRFLDDLYREEREA